MLFLASQLWTYKKFSFTDKRINSKKKGMVWQTCMKLNNLLSFFILLYKLFEWICCGNVRFSVCSDLSSTSIFIKSIWTAFSTDSSTFSSSSFPVSAETLSTAQVIVLCRLISLSYRSNEFLLFSSVLWVKENTDGT